MDVAHTAERLMAEAVAHQQAVLRVDPSDPVAELRAQVRKLARRDGRRIRTGLVDDVLAVVLVEADLWHQSTAVMRRTLTPES